MKKIVLFLGALLVSVSLSAGSMADDFVKAYSAYNELAVSVQSKTQIYVEFSKFLLSQMEKYKFLKGEDVDISARFVSYLESLVIDETCKSFIIKFYLNFGITEQAHEQVEAADVAHYFVRMIYDEMLPGVSFCFNMPKEAERLKFGCSSGS